MQLFFQKIGQGQPFIILHGLYGSSDNWITLGRSLADEFSVYLIDQRNHGKSSHTDSNTYEDMAADLHDLVISENLGKIILLGHSMGGKTAMLYAMLYPEEIKALIVADVAPDGYTQTDGNSPHVISHLNIINAMTSVDLANAGSRTAIEDSLKKNIPDTATRMFIMKNILRNHDNSFSWKLNIPALLKALPDIMGPVPLKNASPPLTRFPVLFIKGDRSAYITEKNTETIHKLFPNARIVTISNAGHWVHAEQPELFRSALLDFLTLPK